MRRANIKGALVGVEAVTPEGLKAVFKDWNYSGEALARQLQTFNSTAFMCWGHLSSGCPLTSLNLRCHRGDGAQGRCHLCPVRHDDAVSGHRGFVRWEKEQAKNPTMVGDVPLPATG